MADRERDLTNILSNVEKEMQDVAPVPTPRSVVESFAPQKYRSANDSMEQIQQDLRKAITYLESRSRALIEELKRITG